MLNRQILKNGIYWMGLLLIAPSCVKTSPGVREVIFYYQIEIINPDPLADFVKSRLEESFPKKKYAITNSSGLEEPFFQEFDLNIPILKDSLMPPHSFAHRMEPLDTNTPPPGSRLLRIHLFPENFPSYSMEIFQEEAGDWKFLAQTGIHPIHIENLEKKEIANDFRKSIIRYSFK